LDAGSAWYISQQVWWWNSINNFKRSHLGGGVNIFIVVVHTGPKANTNKTQTSRFTWFPKTGYVHGGNRLYIIEGMIQTLNSTQYNPTKPSVSLLHSVFLSNLHYFTLTVALSLLPLHTHCTLSSLSFFSSVYMRRGIINIVVVKERVVGSG
jgi:hypothetical protein